MEISCNFSKWIDSQNSELSLEWGFFLGLFLQDFKMFWIKFPEENFCLLNFPSQWFLRPLAFLSDGRQLACYTSIFGNLPHVTICMVALTVHHVSTFRWFGKSRHAFSRNPRVSRFGATPSSFHSSGFSKTFIKGAHFIFSFHISLISKLHFHLLKALQLYFLYLACLHPNHFSQYLWRPTRWANQLTSNWSHATPS